MIFFFKKNYTRLAFQVLLSSKSGRFGAWIMLSGSGCRVLMREVDTILENGRRIGPMQNKYIQRKSPALLIQQIKYE